MKRWTYGDFCSLSVSMWHIQLKYSNALHIQIESWQLWLMSPAGKCIIHTITHREDASFSMVSFQTHSSLVMSNHLKNKCGRAASSASERLCYWSQFTDSSSSQIMSLITRRLIRPLIRKQCWHFVERMNNLFILAAAFKMSHVIAGSLSHMQSQRQGGVWVEMCVKMRLWISHGPRVRGHRVTQGIGERVHTEVCVNTGS